MEALDTTSSTIKPGPSKLSFTGKILIGLTGGLGVSLTVLCYPFVAPALRKVCLPYVPATPAQIDNALRALRHRSGAGGRSSLLDVGSGDGRVVIAAAERGGFRADGVELNPWLVLFSRCRAWKRRVGGAARFHRADLWCFDVRPYENVVVFGVEQMMDQLGEKIEAECEDGTAVVACRFPFKKWRPVEVIGEGVDTVWSYRIRKE